MRTPLLLSAFCLAMAFALVARAQPWDPRFNRGLEYKLMYSCVHNIAKDDAEFDDIEAIIGRCACAMKMSQENGMWPDYNDDKYYKNRKDFADSLEENYGHCKG